MKPEIIHRSRSVAKPVTSKHRVPTRSETRASKHKAKPGTLLVRIVSASIRDAKLADEVAPAAGVTFVVTITPDTRGAKPVRKLEAQPATLAAIQLPPGDYRIDVEQTVSTVLQAYPAGACIAAMGSGATTTATVVLANEPLRDIADLCDLRIGVQVRPAAGAFAQTMLDILDTELNVAEVGLFWESTQSYAPNVAAPLSAKIVESSKDLATVEAGLIKNGWWAAPPPPPAPQSPVFNSRCWDGMNVGAPTKRFEILPTPIMWINYAQTPSWFMPPWYTAWKAECAAAAAASPPKKPPPQPAAPVPAHPPTYAGAHGPTWADLVVDHVKTMMGFTELLQHKNTVNTWVAPPVYAWVAVNEAFDSSGSPGDMAFWADVRCTKKEIEIERAKLVRKLLEVAHGVDKKAFLLVNDFSIEFYPPSKPTKRAKHKAAVAKLRKDYAKARTFRTMMGHVMKNAGSLKGRVGVGYQLHFVDGAEYFANMSVWRNAFLQGIRQYKKAGLPVVITEMVVQGHSYADDVPTYNAHTYTADPTNAAWAVNAAVYRDIVRTFFSERGCDALCFWGMFDEPGDESMDFYGHLWDAGQTTATGLPPPNPPWVFNGTTLTRKPSYFAVLNGLIDAVVARGKAHAVHNWMRRFLPE